MAAPAIWRGGWMPSPARAARKTRRQRAAVDAVQRCLETPGLQVVVFCDKASVADGLADTLQRSLHDTEVLRHVCLDPQTAEEDDSEPWRRFLTEPEGCRVLVCDVRAEEGLNLHGGRKVALHFDLPATPNRIEQRLGRLDRFGAVDAIRSIAPVCTDDSAEQAWMACLTEGLQVFDSSIASLQYLVEETLRATVTDWSNEGVDGLLRWNTQLAGPTGWAARERRRIDQQDALDAMGDPQSVAFDELEAVDDDWRPWREAFEGFAPQYVVPPAAGGMDRRVAPRRAGFPPELHARQQPPHPAVAARFREPVPRHD